MRWDKDMDKRYNSTLQQPLLFHRTRLYSGIQMHDGEKQNHITYQVAQDVDSLSPLSITTTMAPLSP